MLTLEDFGKVVTFNAITRNWVTGFLFEKMLSISVNVLAFYHECHSLIGYATHYLSIRFVCVIFDTSCALVNYHAVYNRPGYSHILIGSHL